MLIVIPPTCHLNVTSENGVYLISQGKYKSLQCDPYLRFIMGITNAFCLNFMSRFDFNTGSELFLGSHEAHVCCVEYSHPTGEQRLSHNLYLSPEHVSQSCADIIQSSRIDHSDFFNVPPDLQICDILVPLLYSLKTFRCGSMLVILETFVKWKDWRRCVDQKHQYIL